MATQDHEELDGYQQFVEEIDYSEIKRIQIVGEGSFGVVWKGKWRGQDVAVKNITTEAERKAFIVEVRQLSRVKHPNIVKLYGACTHHPNICLVMEYAEGGSLFNVLHCAPKPRYTVAHAMSWALQCAQGVAYLHAMKPKALIHRDLKPPNLLLIMGGQRLKICDFGTAVDKSTYMTNNKGSAAWMAPEVFSSSQYTEKCDVFSWGIILWEILSRKKPFYHIGGSAFRIMWAVYQGMRPPLLRNCPPPIEQLMISCWDADPVNRQNMEKVVEIMTKLSVFFPGAEEPVEEYISDNTDLAEEDEIDARTEYDESDDRLSSEDIQESFPDTINSYRQITLPQPPPNVMLPLTVETREWDTVEDMELQTLPGFDKGVPKQGTTNSIQTAIQTSSSSEREDLVSNDPDLENMHMLLDPHLRPVTPDPNDPESLRIFEEHKQLAQEYFKIQTEIAYVTKHRDELQESLSEEQKSRKQNIIHLQDELNSLMTLYESLQRESNLLNGDMQNPQQNRNQPEEDWEVI